MCLCNLGQPTDDRGRVDTDTLKRILQHNRNPIDRVFVSFLACTDDESSVAYLNAWDDELKNVDVTDDYLSERKEILRAQGSSFKFSYADYVCKMLLGPIDPEIDRLDSAQGCCTIS
jgi:hypothetical protein